MTVSVTGANAMLNFTGGGGPFINNSAAGAMTVSSGDILQFGSVSPAMTFSNSGTVTIDGGVLSYKGVAGVDMSAQPDGHGQHRGRLHLAGAKFLPPEQRHR